MSVMQTTYAPAPWGKGKVALIDFDSLADLATYCESPAVRRSYEDRKGGGRMNGDVTYAGALKLARLGWADKGAEALAVAESAVSKVEREHTMTTFTRRVGVVGKRADLGRFAAGQPECMIALMPTEVPKVGKVITLCASISVSGVISEDAITRRGQMITGLALALDKLGYAVEIYADFSDSYSYNPTRMMKGGCDGFRIRTCVKGAHDVLDPAAVMFAFAHAASLRTLGFAAVYALADSPDGSRYVHPGVIGYPHNPFEDLPEGAIYLPCLLSPEDVPDADEFIVGHLRDLGIVTD